jgi:hypothetical protein
VEFDAGSVTVHIQQPKYNSTGFNNLRGDYLWLTLLSNQKGTNEPSRWTMDLEQE